MLVPDNRNQAISIEEFSDLYGAETIKKDSEEIDRLEAKFNEGKSAEDIRIRKQSELFEAIVNRQIEDSD